MKKNEKRLIPCLSCLAPNGESDLFCDKCGASLITSTLDPMRTIQIQGFLLRKATSGTPAFITLLGVWVIFLPWLMGSVLAMFNVDFHETGVSPFIFFLIFLGLTLVALKILFMVTRNYFVMPGADQNKKIKRRKNIRKAILVLGKTGIFMGAGMVLVSWMTDSVGRTNHFWSGLLMLIVSFGIMACALNRKEEKSSIIKAEV